jgi:tRNA pseudouridine55 synthase
LLVLDKPQGLTSRDVVDRALSWFPRGTRLGHTGTLDPLATGVLVLCAGTATRLTEYVQQMDKTYRTDLLLGARSDTDDADGRVESTAAGPPPDRDAVLGRLQAFIGEIEQVPPTYSAAKVSGRRAYDLARRGQETPLQPRRVHVYGIDLLSYAYPRLELEVRCGKGTYIRALARDLGDRLGCGALVQTLRRLRVGPFTEADALSLSTAAATARARMLPVEAAVAALPRVLLDGPDVRRLRQGQGVPLAHLPLSSDVFSGASEVAAFDRASALVAVAAVDEHKRLLLPIKVLPDS